jgi:hypothetical protein
MKPEDRSMKLQGEDRSSQSLHGEDRWIDFKSKDAFSQVVKGILICTTW